MINIDTIKRLSTQHQTTSFNVIREYCQHLFLSYFYQNKNSAYLLFKGGTALRFIYKSPRFSEDLDFTSLVLTKSRLEDIVQDVLVEIDRLGIRVTLEEFESTSGGYIVIIEFSLLRYNVSIQLNISSRKARAIKGDVILIANDFIPAYNIIQLPGNLLIGEKIEALLGRAKPRDYFDLYFILRSNLLPSKERKILPRVLDRLNQEKHNFAIELKNFLPRSHQGIIKDFPAILRRELRKFL